MKSVALSLIILFLGFTVTDSYSQTTEKKKGGSSGGLGFFKPGIHTIQFSKMNEFLPDGYPVITNNPLVTGGAGYAVFSNFMIGGEAGTIRAGAFTKSNQVIDLTGDYGFFSLGYLLVNKRGLLVYPLISIGDNTIEMFIHEKDITTNFNSVTGEPYQSATLKYNTKMLKLALSGAYTVMGSKSEQGSGGLMIGIEAGYQMAYKAGTWKFDNGGISGGPDFSNNGFFIQLLIGGGGVMKK